MNAEIKVVDTTVSGSISSSGSLFLVNGIAQGDGNSNRDGNSVKSKGGSFRWIATQSGSASRSFLRLLVVADTRCNGAAPSVTDVLNSASVYAHPNLVSEPNRYVILHDSVQLMDAASRTACFGEVALPQLTDVHFTYSGTGATVASVSGMSVHVLALSNEPTNTPSLSSEFRILYLDN